MVCMCVCYVSGPQRIIKVVRDMKINVRNAHHLFIPSFYWDFFFLFYSMWSLCTKLTHKILITSEILIARLPSTSTNNRLRYSREKHGSPGLTHRRLQLFSKHWIKSGVNAMSRTQHRQLLTKLQVTQIAGFHARKTPYRRSCTNFIDGIWALSS